MAADELIAEHVSLKQSKKAVDSLYTHAKQWEEKRNANELLPGKEQYIWLNVAVKKVNAEKKFKPKKIPLVHPLVDPRTSPVCLIVKDPQREYKDLLEQHGIKFISRVVGIAKLKGKFKPFEARRALLKENGMFLVDDRVVEMMPKLLGVKWFEAKKQPIPVSMLRKDLKKELENAINATYMNQNRGTQVSIKIAALTHTPAQILQNLQKALPAIVAHIPDGWENVQSIAIKTNSSVSLPIWNCSLDDEEGGRWSGLTTKSIFEERAEANDDEDEMSVDEAAVPAPKAKKAGSKRASDDKADETEKPRKKAKGVEGIAVTPIESVKPKSVTKAVADSAVNALAKSKKRKLGDKTVVEETPAKSIKSTPTKATPAEPISITPVEESSTPAKKSKKTSKESTSTTNDLATQITAANQENHDAASSIGKKKSKRKSAAADEAPSSLIETEASETPAADGEKKKKLNKKAKARLAAAEAEKAATSLPVSAVDETLVAIAPTDANEAPKEKKKSKRKSLATAEDEPQPPAPPAPTPAIASSEKESTKAKKAKKTRESAVVPEPAPVTEEVAPSPEKLSRKEKKEKTKSAAAEAANALKPEELKQKRDATRASGEKKKDKVVKGKGKSAKDALLGKKAGQE